MSVWTTSATFVACIAAMSWGSVRLTQVLERIGARFRLSDALLGIIVASGADAPEISSAVAALLAQRHEVGFGVVIGSNIFNLAGLLGLSAVVAGRVRIGREGLWLNGGVSLAVSAVVLALLFRLVPVAVGVVLLFLALIPYAALATFRPHRIAGFRLPHGMRAFLGKAVAHSHQHGHRSSRAAPASWRDGVWLAISIVAIVGASFLAVDSAVTLGLRWGINDTIIGMLVLAALTSVPNVVAAIKLAREGRGAAVISEALNSNSFNVLAGIALPAIAIGFVAPEPSILYAAVWLLVMKLVALLAASHKRGLSRGGGALVIGLYLMFAAVLLYRG
jgi:cation:H+ antiporter